MTKKLTEFLESYINKQSIFKDKRALQSNYTPKRAPYRGEQINQLASILAPSLRMEKPSNVFVYGRPGTGKTLVAKYVTHSITKIAEKNKKNVTIVYLNCKMKRVADTEYRLVAQLLKGLGVSVPDTGLPTDVLYHKLFEKIDEKRQHIIIALDEIDSLVRKTGDGFLYSLTRMNSELKNASITTIGITNDVLFLEGLDVRVRSSLSEEELVFKPYDAVQLQDVLQERVFEGFREDVVSPEVVSLCAAIAAQEHGDARRALDLLRIAGETAERNNDNKVTDLHVNEAQDKIDVERTIEVIKGQPKQSQAVLITIIKLIEAQKKQGRWTDKRLLTGSVYESYRETCGRNNLKPLTQRRVGDLISELDMLGIISTKVISKGRYGRTREISLALNETIAHKAERILADKFY
ncbi:MAG: orc1/cdc6 family replication initiation protein [Candidatus Diapherotrites archaeon]|uniref:ORC1-type DNA replication protein n=1 Tax=Candidatus Iainarchaeum sp. TaxID=3101447 RepID=A0A8T4KQ40_9ARCH|nr:orc1/cdc6 family replication initiation protein [Candidatus Diapherotrites archaeon]